MFLPPQSAAKPPPIGFPLRGIQAAQRPPFPQNQHFIRPPEGGDTMAVFRIVKNRDHTVTTNHHLWNAGLFLKSKGLLFMVLPLPENKNYTTRGLAEICKMRPSNTPTGTGKSTLCRTCFSVSIAAQKCTFA